MHGLLALPFLGLFDSSLPTGQRQQCAALLDFFLLLLGWLVPVYSAAMRQVAAMGGGGAARAGGGGGSSRAVRSNSGDAAASVERGPSNAQQRVAAWLARHAFQDGGTAEVRLHCWLALAGLCWLAGCCTAAAMPALQ
jgi:hypothetical protein